MTVIGIHDSDSKNALKDIYFSKKKKKCTIAPSYSHASSSFSPPSPPLLAPFSPYSRDGTDCHVTANVRIM